MRRLIFTLYIMFFSGSLFSAGTPVFDSTNYLENILTKIETKLIVFNSKVNNNYAIKRTRRQLKQIEFARNNINRLKRQYEAITGKYGYGTWLKGPSRLLDRSYRPKSQEEFLRLTRQGEATGENSRDRNAWVNLYRPPDPKKINIDGKESPRSKQQNEFIDDTLALKLKSNYLLYEDGEKRIKALEEIADKIETTENIKAALDLLNTNVLALHITNEKILDLQSRLAHREAVRDTGGVLNRKSYQDFMKWE